MLNAKEKYVRKVFRRSSKVPNDFICGVVYDIPRPNTPDNIYNTKTRPSIRRFQICLKWPNLDVLMKKYHIVYLIDPSYKVDRWPPLDSCSWLHHIWVYLIGLDLIVLHGNQSISVWKFEKAIFYMIYFTKIKTCKKTKSNLKFHISLKACAKKCTKLWKHVKEKCGKLTYGWTNSQRRTGPTDITIP